MRDSWTYKNAEDGIDEAHWLAEYVRNNWQKYDTQAALKAAVLPAFKDAHPMIPHLKNDGDRENETEMSDRYKQLDKVCCEKNYFLDEISDIFSARAKMG